MDNRNSIVVTLEGVQPHADHLAGEPKGVGLRLKHPAEPSVACPAAQSAQAPGANDGEQSLKRAAHVGA
jgi:hypothetical protein